MRRGEDKYYGELSEAVSSRLYRSGVSKEAIGSLLEGKELRKEIELFRREMVPERVIYGLVSAGIGQAMKEGKKAVSIGPETVAFAIYSRLEKSKTYRNLADELVEEGIIDKKDVKRYIENVKKHKKETGRTVRSLARIIDESKDGDELRRVAAIIVSFGISGWFLLKSLFSGGYTAAVIGGGVLDSNIVYGLVFLLLGMALTHFWKIKD